MHTYELAHIQCTLKHTCTLKHMYKTAKGANNTCTAYTHVHIDTAKYMHTYIRTHINKLTYTYIHVLMLIHTAYKHIN